MYTLLYVPNARVTKSLPAGTAVMYNVVKGHHKQVDKNFAKLYPIPPMPSHEERPTFWFEYMFGSTMAAFFVHADSLTLVRIELLAITTPALETKGVLEIFHW